MSKRWRHLENHYPFLRREVCAKDGHTWGNQFDFKGERHRTCSICGWRQKGNWEYNKRLGFVFKVNQEGPGYLKVGIR